MNQPLYPYLIPGMQGNPASFVANSTLILGTYVKPLDATTQITVDYSALTPSVTLKGYSFRVTPGGSPQLTLSASALDTTNTLLTFMLSGGIGGRAYEVKVVVTLQSGETRSDVLTVQVLGDDCDCSVVLPPLPNQDVTSGDGSLIVNDFPRFFVSATMPVGANVLDRWYNTTTGGLYDYISNGIYSFWVPYGSTGGGGGGGGGVGSNVVIVSISPIQPDGVTSVFTLTSVSGVAVNILASNSLFVSVDGVWQDATLQYIAAGNQISFVQPPSADSVVFMQWFAPAP